MRLKWQRARALLLLFPLCLVLKPANGASPPEGDSHEYGDINVRDFGAKGDGITDDTSAINAAFSYLRSTPVLGTDQPGITLQNFPATVVFPRGAYKVTSPLNWTGLKSVSFNIDGHGSVILGSGRGLPVVDALGSRWLHVSNLTISGSLTDPPSIGLQLGRLETNSPADGSSFNNIMITGSFSFAALYDFASETTIFNHMFAWNRNASKNSYTVVLDGINHWGVSSRFTSLSAAKDTPASFNESLFVNPSIMATGGGTPLWIANSSRTSFQAGYFANTSGQCGAVLYSPAKWPLVMLNMDVHFENRSIKNIFCVDGPPETSQASIFGLRYHDNFPEATISIFSLSSNLKGGSLINADLYIHNYLNDSIRVFEHPESWYGSGIYKGPDGRYWNLLDKSWLNGNIISGYDVQSKSLRDEQRQAVQADITSIPNRSSEPCNSGEMRIDRNYVYYCIAKDSWKRAELKSW